MSKLKIELSMEDLKKILHIGENDEVEIEVKNTIVQAFSKRYLKGVIDEQLFKKQLKSYLNNFSPSYIKDKIEEKIKEEFNKVILESFDKEAYKIMREYYEDFKEEIKLNFNEENIKKLMKNEIWLFMEIAVKFLNRGLAEEDEK